MGDGLATEDTEVTESGQRHGVGHAGARLETSGWRKRDFWCVLSWAFVRGWGKSEPRRHDEHEDSGIGAGGPGFGSRGGCGFEVFRKGAKVSARPMVATHGVLPQRTPRSQRVGNDTAWGTQARGWGNRIVHRPIRQLMRVVRRLSLVRGRGKSEPRRHEEFSAADDRDQCSLATEITEVTESGGRPWSASPAVRILRHLRWTGRSQSRRT